MSRAPHRSPLPSRRSASPRRWTGGGAFFVVEHRGFALALDALGQGAALKPHWGFIHYRTRSNPLNSHKKNTAGWRCFFVVEHRGFVLALDALGQGAALKPHWGFIHYRARSNPLNSHKKNTAGWRCFFVVEHRGFEPLTSTLRTLRATNCANAPCVNALSIIHIREKKARTF